MYTPIPSGFPHRALEQTTLAGYDVPKGAFIVTGLQVAHWDAKHFEEPRRFRPERFLDDRGRLALCQDTTLPFGAGKRLCAGETFSRNLMFVLVAALAQSFNVSVANDATMSGKAAVMETSKLLDSAAFSTGIVSFPPALWVNFEQR